MTRGQPVAVVVVGTDTTGAGRLGTQLRREAPHEFDVTYSSELATPRERKAAAAAVVVVDLRRAAGGPLRAMRRLDQAVRLRSIVALVDPYDEALIPELLAAGAADCLVDGDFTGAVLAHAVRRAAQRRRARPPRRARAGGAERLIEEADRRRRRAEALAGVARLLSQSLDRAEVADLISEQARSLLGAGASSLFDLQPETGSLVSLSLKGEHGLLPAQTIAYPRGHGAIGLAVERRRPVATLDLLADPQIRVPASHRARLESIPYRAVLAMPLIVQDRVIGALAVVDRVGRAFTADEIHTVQDFADRAALALENARLFEEARDARDFLQSIAQSSADAIITSDVHGRITYWSPGAEEILGFRAEEMLGRRAAELYKEGESEARGLMKRLVAEGRVRDYTLSVRARDGRWLDISASFAPLRDATGAIIGTLGVAKDVTERRQLEESLRQSQKMEAMGRLAGGVAHDFNNLMTVVIGRTEIVLGRLGPGDPARRDVELCRRTAERAAALTRQLLAFSRKQVMQPKILDLNGVVTAMSAMLRRIIGEDVELALCLDSALGLVKADPGQIEQVIVNLAVNARDAMPHGGALTITTADASTTGHTDRAPGEYVALAVADTGVGMDEATQARIFEPFFTTKDPTKGTGLGLSTVYGIVKQSGGHVSVMSRVGRGTTIALYLPRVEGRVELVEPEAPAIPLHGRGETILLVEDEDELRAVAQEMLRARGYEVAVARDPIDALRIAGERGPFDLLLTDVIMPRMSGRELAQRLTALVPTMKVLYMSGYTDDALARHGSPDASDPFLEKPFSVEQLVDKVRVALATDAGPAVAGGAASDGAAISTSEGRRAGPESAARRP